MKYSISYSNPLTHLIEISLEIDNIAEENILLRLPSWRPGRYEIVNFAQNILCMEAYTEDGGLIDIKKASKDSWVVPTAEITYVRIRYSYYAYQMDAGNSWLDEEQLYINFINCMLYVADRMEESCIVGLDLPDDYNIACGLSEKARHSLCAESYYQLVDSPMIASNNLSHFEYVVEETSFNIWIQGEYQLDTDKMIHDFELFTKVQIKMMGNFPCHSYHFLIQSLPYKHYHGVEHQNSTVITLGPGHTLSQTSIYRALLGISSHELFHTWNVIRIRPRELLPYDFSKENYFETGYVAEGFTTYYGDLFLIRSGTLDIDWYLGKLNKMLKNHFENFGRTNMSVADSSLDLWLDGYVAGAPNRKVSIYNEGAIVALMIDLQIRVSTVHVKSLDDIMRGLWQIHGKTNIGYNKKAILALLNECVSYNWDSFLDNYIYGTSPIEELLSTLLAHFGLELRKCFSNEKHESMWGFRMDTDKRIVKIQPQSISEHYLSIGDQVKSIENNPAHGTETSTVIVERNNKELSLEIPLGDEQYFGYYEIEPMKTITDTQKEALENWLGA